MSETTYDTIDLKSITFITDSPFDTIANKYYGGAAGGGKSYQMSVGASNPGSIGPWWTGGDWPNIHPWTDPDNGDGLREYTRIMRGEKGLPHDPDSRCGICNEVYDQQLAMLNMTRQDFKGKRNRGRRKNSSRRNAMLTTIRKSLLRMAMKCQTTA